MTIILVIAILISVPAFYGIRWGLGKFLRGKQRPAFLTYLFTFAFAFFVYFALTFTVFLYGSPFESQMKFDQDRWTSRPEKRFRMQEDLAAGKLLAAKGENQVIQLLGQPDSRDSLGTWTYHLGHSTSGFAYVHYYLEVDFENGKVKDAESKRHID